MADRFWVGGSGNWDATSTANWSDTSGGSAGASAPTSADDVYFDANSNVGTGTFTVTVTGTSASPAVCKSFATGGVGGALDGAMTLTMGATAVLDFYESMTLPATNFSISGTTGGAFRFRGTTSQTLTTNGVSFSATGLTVNGVGGTLTLGSALTMTDAVVTITNGTFNTSASNYNVTAAGIVSTNSNVRAITLNGSTLTFNGTAPLNFATSTNLTFTAGTSTITCTASAPTFTGGGQTFYNVTFSGTAAGFTTSITGANTFNDLTQTSVASTGIRFFALSDNQTVNGALTLGAANTAIRRIFCNSAPGVQRTITLNGTLATLSDVDFRNIVAAGTVATPWTGTRLGNCTGNSNITFDAPKTVYWNLAGSQNWSATGWATTNNGAPDVNNFPLAQDTATFTEAGAAGTVTIEMPWQIGSIQMADGVSNRTTAFTFNTSLTANVYGNVTFFSNLVLSGTAAIGFTGQGVTQTFTSAGRTLTQGVTISSATGTLQLQDNLTLGSTLTTTLTSGTLNLNNNTLSTGIFSSFNSNVRSIAFGSGNITLTGNAGTILGIETATNFTRTGTPTINSTYSGSTGTRTFRLGDGAGGSAANAVLLNITAGSDITSVLGFYTNITYSSFSGSATFAASLTGNLSLSSTMTSNSTSNILNFIGTSGVQTITSNGVTFNQPITFNGVGGTFQLQDNMTVGSTRTVTLTNGTLDLTGNSGNWTLSTGLFGSNNTNTRTLAFGTGKIVLTGNAARILDMGNVTGLTTTGNKDIEANYSGGTGTREIFFAVNAGGSEANAVSVAVTAGTDTVNVAQNIKNLNFTGFSGTLSAATRVVYGNLTFSAGMTVNAGTSATTFAGTSGIQQITTAGKTLDFPVTFNGVGGTFQLQDNMTVGSTRTVTLAAGTLDLTGNSGNWTLSCGLFSSSTSVIRAIAFGTGNITVTGNAAAVWGFGTATNFSYTGTPTVNLTYSGGTGTRTVAHGSTGGGVETNSLSFFVSAGTDTVSFTGRARVLSFSGFSGTLSNSARTIYGSLTISSGMTLTAGTNATTFAGTSGTQQITTAGKTLDFPLTFNGIGGTFAFADALTQGSTRAFTITNGTVQLKDGVTSTVGSFATSGTNQKFLQSTLAGSQATLSQASGTVNASYLTIKDINATGGATWNAYFINNNVDDGNNTGWNFTDSPSNVAEFGMRLRSFTEPRRF